MDHVLMALQETKDERDLKIRALFDFFDAANLGYLDYPQIEAGLSALQIPSHYKYAKDLFNVCDTHSKENKIAERERRIKVTVGAKLNAKEPMAKARTCTTAIFVCHCSVHRHH